MNASRNAWCAFLALAACGGSAEMAPLVVRTPKAAFVPPAGAASTTPEIRRPERGKLLEAPMPKVEEATLACGARVLFIERHKPLPIVAIRAVVDRGVSDAEPGVAALMAQTLMTGTTRRSETVLWQELNEMGAKTSYGASYDATSITLEVPRANLSGAMRILGDVVQHAEFPEEEVVRVRGRLLAHHDWAKVGPRSRAFEALLPNLFPSGNLLREPESGSIASVGPRTPEEVRAFYKLTFTPANTTFVVAGDTDLRTLVTGLNKELAPWKPNGTSPSPRSYPPVEPHARRVLILDHPGDSQAAIAIGALGPAALHDDGPTLSVISFILGEGVIGRLGRILRMGHGATYGFDAGVASERAGGIFWISGSVETGRTAEALKDIFAEIERLRSENADATELPAAELDDMVRHSKDMETVGELTGFLTGAAVYKRTPEAMFARWRAVRRTTPEEIHRVATTYLDPTKMQVVIVGDAAKFKDAPEVRALGEIEVRPMR